MIEVPPASRDEDVLVFPDEWREALYPRRGGLPPVPAVEIDPSAQAEIDGWLERARPRIDAVLDDERSEREFVEAARDYLRGQANPLGAAVVACIDEELRYGRQIKPWIDAWAAAHGLAFAACACLEMDQVHISTHHDRETYEKELDYVGPSIYVDSTSVGGFHGRRVRALLAVTDEKSYQETVERLADYRQTPTERYAVSFLVPTRQDWVDECCAEPVERHRSKLWCSLGSADQLARLGDWAEFGEYGRWQACLVTAVEGVGPAVAPQLARAFDDESDAGDRRRIVAVLGELPTDEAFLLVAERLDQEYVLPVAQAMIERFPRRAMRVLPQVSAGTSKRAKLAAGLLNAHLLARPDLLAEVLPGLDDEAKAAIQAIEEARVDEASAGDVPKTLLKGGKKGPPSWAPPTTLPQILLRGRDLALPAAATGHLVEALAKASPRRSPPTALDALDPGSLAEFGWALFERWRVSGESRIGWATSQLAWTGDDETARRLGGMARSWPGQDGVKLPLNGLDVLAAIGTDVAVMQLHLVSEKARPKRLKNKAAQLLHQVAANRGLTMEQLGDRIVPDFGLDADDGMTLDYGPRRFRVGFDEELKPYVTDDQGKLRKALPKPGAKDDPELAPAAYRTFTGLKKDVRTVAADQIRRMERAMSEQRRWETADFQTLFVGHPLLWHIVKRLAWLHEDGGKTTAFRVAEDRTFADVHDDVLTLPETGTVRIAHPVHLGETIGAWSEVFADYEILQPFPQLGRPTFAFTEKEREGGKLDRLDGIAVSTGKVLGLERMGWERGTPLDGGVQCEMVWTAPGGSTIVLDVAPGFPVMSPAEWPEQTLGAVQITTPGSEARFEELDDVTASELLLALTTLTE
ncbi:DUF4132 domain-containing protein [Spirillospora sp. NPDC048911]|uniref:DUF4132 domain-containing protein n=1 Tax=Spirillospora sp. NPDC048911 TaxID=3364527 RepID=UPI00371DF89B